MGIKVGKIAGMVEEGQGGIPPPPPQKKRSTVMIKKALTEWSGACLGSAASSASSVDKETKILIFA